MKVFNIELNKEEILVGSLVGFVFMHILRSWVLLAMPVCAFLWALGGAKGTSLGWRRFGVSIALCSILSIASQTWIPFICFLPLLGAISLPYGIPTFHGPDGSCDDKGSIIGRFIYYNIADEIEDLANSYTRLFIGVLMALAMLPLAWIDFYGWLMGAIILPIGYALIVYESGLIE